MTLLHALRGALGFLSRVPVGCDDRAWDAFRTTPVAFPLAGYAVGATVAVPVALPAVLAAVGRAVARLGVSVPDVSTPGGALDPAVAPTVALLYPVVVYAVTGIAHLDGLADLGDAAVVHGDADRRLSVAADSRVGVGGTLAVTLAVAALALAGLALVTLAGTAPSTALRAVAVVVASEVAAKLGMVVVAALGEVAHEGMGSQVVDVLDPRSMVLPAAVAAPAVALSWPLPAAAVALTCGLLGALATLWWARRRLGGVNGDVIGAANELARIAGLHAGVVAWTLS